jgi:hypothetical protein
MVTVPGGPPLAVPLPNTVGTCRFRLSGDVPDAEGQKAIEFVPDAGSKEVPVRTNVTGGSVK